MKNKGCLITEKAAEKIFGKESPVGKKIKRSDDLYLISAVVKMPKNTQICFDILDINAPIYIRYGTHFIMLKEGIKLTPELKKQIANSMPPNSEGVKNKLVMQPLKDIHLHSPKEVTEEVMYKIEQIYGSLSQICYFSFAALLILFIAIINYVNTSIARSLNRTKEVGVRKVTGANRRRIIERFLSESFVLSVLAVLVALVLVQLLFPGFTNIMGNKVPLKFDWLTILIACVFCVIITLLSGGYAAFYLSSFSIANILRGGSKTSSKENLRKILIGVQSLLSVGILICTFFIYKQIYAIFNADTGMDRKNIIVLDTGLWDGAENFIQVIKQENTNIIDATIANCPPYNATWGYSNVSWEGSNDADNDIGFVQIFCDHHYSNTFGLKMLQGEFIPPGLTWWQDSKAESFNIVINESFKKVIGVENPIGITVTYGINVTYRGKIIGVVKDFNFKPLKEKISPLIISFNPEACEIVYIKTTGKDKQKTLSYILEKYKELKSDLFNRPVMYHTVESEYNKMYKAELRTAGILSVFAVISFLLSLMGIISMISFMIEKRTKEIAIRKINGAGIWDIVKLFAGSILKIAAVASVIAIPICYLLMSKWLEDYIYRTSLSWWIFALIPLCLLLVIFVVISIQVYITARQNPVESLRSE